jgi:hypothetical protein
MCDFLLSIIDSPFSKGIAWVFLKRSNSLGSMQIQRRLESYIMALPVIG